MDAYGLIQNQIVVPLERIDGVASVTANGLEEKEILIELDRERTEAAGLNIYQLAQELGNDNFSLASGWVVDGGSKMLLRSVARYEDLDALRNRPVAPSVRLSDVATVRYQAPDRDFRVRANSRPAVALVVFKEGPANAIQVADRINRVVEELQDDPRLNAVDMVPLFDQAQVIRESLSTLVNSGKIGGFFAILVLFFFLRRFRMTMIITLAIPLSLVMALTVMFFAGETLNVLSLLGLVISIGLLVDNSVVVAENIHRLHATGVSRREAAIRGAGEIALAVTMATLTTIIVFLPVSLVEGQAQVILLRLSIPISVALAASLVVAGVFVPLSVYLTLRNGKPRGQSRLARTWNRFHDGMENVLARLYDATLGRLNAAYNRLLALSLRRRLDLVLVLAAVFALTVGVAFRSLEVVPIQDEERTSIEVSVEMPPNMTLEETEQYFLECEKVLEEMGDELDLSGHFLFHQVRYGELEGWFNNPRTKPDLTPREATERLMERLPEKPGVKLYTGQESDVEESDDQTTYAVTLYGEDSEELEVVAERLEETLVALDGVLGLQRSGELPPSELGLIIDRERAQRIGVSPQVVAGVVGYALRGQQLNRYWQDGRDIPVRVRFEEEDRSSLDDLNSFWVPAADGFVSVASISDTEFLQSRRGIYRRDKQIARSITLELEEGREDEARQRLGAFVRQLDLPEGVSVGTGRTSSSANEDQEALQFAALVSVVFIYLLMGFLFESFILPLSIVSTIPLASIGVGWIHWAVGRNIDMLGIVGGILLIGVVVNNGIVLIDYVNRLRAGGMDRTEALLTAAHRRFRPIMMTATTTICGMVPLTLGGPTSIGLSYTSFGLTLIGGMTTATLLTLLVVPVFYTFFDDAREHASRVAKAALTARGAPAATETASE